MQTPTFFVDRSPSVDSVAASAVAAAADSAGLGDSVVAAASLDPQPASMEAAKTVEAMIRKNFFVNFFPPFFPVNLCSPRLSCYFVTALKNIENSSLNL